MGFTHFAQALGFGQPATLSAEEPAGSYAADVTPPARSAAASSLSVDRALSLTTVFRAIQLIMGIGSYLELDSWRRGGRELVDPQHPLIAKPDPWRSRGDFLRRYMVNAATDGNNFLLRHFYPGTAQVAGLEVLNPFATTVRWEKGGVKKFDTYDARTGKWVSYGTDRVKHVWCGIPVPGHDRALGPIAAARVGLNGHINVRDYAAGWFDGESDVPSGVLSSDQSLDVAMMRETKRAWLHPEELTNPDGTVTRHYGPTVRVLQKGLTYQPIMLRPADAQWIESQNFGVLDVARLFGLPAEYLEAAVEGSSLVYSSLPMLATRFLTTTQYPLYLAPLEEALAEELPNGQSARFSAARLLEPDPKTRAEVDEINTRIGVYDAAYIRHRDHIDAAAPVTTPAPQEVAP